MKSPYGLMGYISTFQGLFTECKLDNSQMRYGQKTWDLNHRGPGKTMGCLSLERCLYWRIHGISYIWMSQNAKTKIYQSCRRHSWLLQAKVLSPPPMQPMDPILHVHSMLWNEDIWNLKSETSDVWIRTGHLYKPKKAPPPLREGPK